jgi:hypothetical protein
MPTSAPAAAVENTANKSASSTPSYKDTERRTSPSLTVSNALLCSAPP